MSQQKNTINEQSSIEDLTLNEAAAENVKGGPDRTFVADSFSFGVEREMKESGEKG
jgi:hypothetical protein